MRLIDADLLVKKLRMLLKDFKNAPTKKYVIKIILSMLGDKNQIWLLERIHISLHLLLLFLTGAILPGLRK